MEERKPHHKRRPRRRPTVDNRKKEFVKNFEETTKNFQRIQNFDTKPERLSDKFRRFAQKIGNEENKRLMNLLPIFLLAVTIIAIKNKKILIPISLSYYEAAQYFKDSDKFIVRFLGVVNAYIKIIRQMDVMESIDIATTTVSLFLEEIPGLFTKLNADVDIPPMKIYKNIMLNIGELKRDLIDRTGRDARFKKESSHKQNVLDRIQQEISNIQKRLDNRRTSGIQRKSSSIKK